MQRREPASMPHPSMPGRANGDAAMLNFAPAGGEAEAAVQDWDELFKAIAARLARMASADSAAPASLLLPDTPPLMRAGVLECVAAMEQLHLTLTHERVQRHELERELLDARTALARVRVELVSSLSHERRSRSMALHDELTALPNRSFFGEWLDRAVEQAENESGRLAVLYLDLDGFKGVNDTHGQDVGDELLQIIAARLARAVRAGDVVSRLGSDEFACLLTDVPDREQLGHLACKLFDAVSAPVKIGPHELSVCPSIGVAMYPEDGATAQVLIDSADAAMHHAKQHRSGYAFFAQYHDG